jgi:Rrf2 family protein
MLSQKCKYALRITLYLSMHSSNTKKISAVTISDSLKIPAAFTSKILQQLTADNIVSSSKGPNGGFFLTKENKQKKIIDIVKSIDGMDFFTQCGLGLNECSDKRPCPLHNDFVKIRNIFLKTASENSIDKLSQKVILERLALTR